jgi:hypothetical protein
MKGGSILIEYQVMEKRELQNYDGFSYDVKYQKNKRVNPSK